MTAARAAGWVAVVLLALVPVWAGGGGALPPLPDPFARLAADLEWIAFQRARRDGRPAQALRHATRALALAPRATAGWSLAADWMAFEQASPGLSLALRRRWFEAALELTRAGERAGADPRRLRETRALLLAAKASHDPALGLADPDDGEPSAEELAAGAIRLRARAAEAFRAAGAEELARAVEAGR